MKHTPSGAIATGAPNSYARHIAEAEHAHKKDAYQLLLLTDEGCNLLTAFGMTVGCDFQRMLEFEKSDDKNAGFVTEWILKEEEKLSLWMNGIMAADSIIKAQSLT